MVVLFLCNDFSVGPKSESSNILEFSETKILEYCTVFFNCSNLAITYATSLLVLNGPVAKRVYEEKTSRSTIAVLFPGISSLLVE